MHLKFSLNHNTGLKWKSSKKIWRLKKILAIDFKNKIKVKGKECYVQLILNFTCNDDDDNVGDNNGKQKRRK